MNKDMYGFISLNNNLHKKYQKIYIYTCLNGLSCWCIITVQLMSATEVKYCIVIFVVISFYIGNLFVEKKDECQALQEQNQALRKKLESLQNKSQSETSRMEKEQEVTIFTALKHKHWYDLSKYDWYRKAHSRCSDNVWLCDPNVVFIPSIQKNQASPSKDQDKSSTPLPSIEKSQNRPADEHFPSYIHNSVTTPETSPSKEEQQPEQAFLNDKMPTQESLGYESHSGKNRSVRTSESTSSFERIDPSPSESFLEHIAGQTDSPQNLNRQLSTKVNYSSSGSLNLMEFPSMSESHRVISCPQEELFDPLTDRASVSHSNYIYCPLHFFSLKEMRTTLGFHRCHNH